MVFKEIQHIWLDVSQELPVSCDARSGLPQFDRHSVVVHILLHDCAQGVIQA